MKTDTPTRFQRREMAVVSIVFHHAFPFRLPDDDFPAHPYRIEIQFVENGPTPNGIDPGGFYLSERLMLPAHLSESQFAMLSHSLLSQEMVDVEWDHLTQTIRMVRPLPGTRQYALRIRYYEQQLRHPASSQRPKAIQWVPLHPFRLSFGYRGIRLIHELPAPEQEISRFIDLGDTLGLAYRSLAPGEPIWAAVCLESAAVLALRVGDRVIGQVAEFCLVDPGQRWGGMYFGFGGN